MDIGTFVHWAQKYSDLGWSVQEQFKDYVTFGDDEGLNPNAVHVIEEFISNIGLKTDVDISGYEEV